MGTFIKKMVTLSLWGFVTTIFYDTHYAAVFEFFYRFFFGYIWLHLVTFGYIFKKKRNKIETHRETIIRVLIFFHLSIVNIEMAQSRADSKFNS